MDFDSISLLPFHLKNQKRNSKTNEKAMQRPLTCTSCESDIRKDIRQRFFWKFRWIRHPIWLVSRVSFLWLPRHKEATSESSARSIALAYSYRALLLFFFLLVSFLLIVRRVDSFGSRYQQADLHSFRFLADSDCFSSSPIIYEFPAIRLISRIRSRIICLDLKRTITELRGIRLSWNGLHKEIKSSDVRAIHV